MAEIPPPPAHDPPPAAPAKGDEAGDGRAEEVKRDALRTC
jgi:hypothetical protein